MMLHYTLAEDAAAVAAVNKTTRKDVWEVASALLLLVACPLMVAVLQAAAHML